MGRRRGRGGRPGVGAARGVFLPSCGRSREAAGAPRRRRRRRLSNMAAPVDVTGGCGTPAWGWPEGAGSGGGAREPRPPQATPLPLRVVVSAQRSRYSLGSSLRPPTPSLLKKPGLEPGVGGKWPSEGDPAPPPAVPSAPRHHHPRNWPRPGLRGPGLESRGPHETQKGRGWPLMGGVQARSAHTPWPFCRSSRT